MIPHSSHEFLKSLDKKLWSAADRLPFNLDIVVYKHPVLALIFLKYVSHSFVVQQAEIEKQLRDPESADFLDSADYGGEASANYLEAIRAELEERDYYIEKNVFWVPALARWKKLQDSAKLPPGTEIAINNGMKTIYKITSTGKLIDDALDAIEKENPNSFYGQDNLARRKRQFGLSQRARRMSTWRRARQSIPTISRLAAMIMAIRGIDFNFGKEPANSFTSDRILISVLTS